MAGTVVPIRRPRMFRAGRALPARVFPETAQADKADLERPWWSRLVDEQTYREMALEIERAKAHISGHERECAIRYEGIRETMADMKASIDLLLQKERGHERKLSNLQIATLVFVVGTMITLIGWMGVQLYHLEPLRSAPAEASR